MTLDRPLGRADTGQMTDQVPPPEGNPDQGVPWHFGEPLREQKWLLAGEALVDLSHRGVVTVTGADRSGWLNDLTTALLLNLPAGEPRTALILDPHGHVEYEVHLVDDGATAWLITAPGEAPGLVAYLRSMQFLLRVEIADRSQEYAVVGGLGDVAVHAAVAVWRVPAEFSGNGTTPAGNDRGGDAGKYVPKRPDVFPAMEAIIPRASLAAVLAAVPYRAGTWAWEALRVAAGVPRAGSDTDARSLPHENGWIGSAVHLAKGCYRGQEAVARTHNMGRPPRRLVLLHLDGSVNRLPLPGDRVILGDKDVGWVGSVAVHHELGPIALAVVKRRTDPLAELSVSGVAARQEQIVV